jgi:hypothetical protein
MSPLWPDFALARAAWANAVDRGLVDDRDLNKADERKADRAKKPLIRHIPRGRARGFAA